MVVEQRSGDGLHPANRSMDVLLSGCLLSLCLFWERISAGAHRAYGRVGIELLASYEVGLGLDPRRP